MLGRCARSASCRLSGKLYLPSNAGLLLVLSALHLLTSALRQGQPHETQPHETESSDTLEQYNETRVTAKTVEASWNCTAADKNVLADRKWWRLLKSRNFEELWRDLVCKFFTGTSNVADLEKVKKNKEGDTKDIALAVALYGSLVVLSGCLFIGLMHMLPRVYAPRAEDPVTWCDALGLSDEAVLKSAGLDALMLIELLRLGRDIAGMLTVILLPILSTLHALETEAEHRFDDFLNTISITSLKYAGEASKHMFWAHAVAVWFVVVLSAGKIVQAQRRFVAHRFAWLERMPLPRAATIMVENIPFKYRSDTALHGLFARLFTDVAVERAYIVRRTGTLRWLVDKKEACRIKLDQAQKQWEESGQDVLKRPRTGCIPFIGDDAIETHTKAFEQLQAEVEMERQRVEGQVLERDSSVVSGTGFVTFTSLRWRRLAAREQLFTEAEKCVMSAALDPEDLIYEDLAFDRLSRASSSIFAVLCIIVIFLIWVPVVVIISGFTELESLKQRIPALKRVFSDSAAPDAVYEGIAPTVMLKIFMSTLPAVLLALVTNFLKPKARTKAQLRLQQFNFFFLIFFVLLVTVIGRSLFFAILALIEHPTQVVHMLADNLPGFSHFYSMYLLLGWFIAVLELLRISPLLQYLFWRMILSPEEAQKKITLSEHSSSDCMGTRMSRVSLMIIIQLVFCTCSPEISIFGLLFCACTGPCYGYLLSLVETKAPDSGGIFWVQALDHVFIGLFLFILLMVGILKGHKANGPAVLAAAALLPCYLGWRRMKNLHWEDQPFDAVAEADISEILMKPERVEGERYTQPECRTEADTGGACS